MILVVLALVVVEFHVLVVVKELLSLAVMDFEYDMERVLIGGIGDESLTLHVPLFFSNCLICKF